MPESNAPEAQLITRPAELHQAVEALLRQPIVAVDTESNSLYAYHEQVCLAQFSIPGADYLVDPLALADLQPLGTLFADTQIEKVFHAAEYDLICLKRDYGFEFENLFDTMLAARILGRESLGLGALLEAEFGVQLDKRQQRANWGQRPLPAKLLAYARLDTHYLIALRQRLRQELKERGLWPLAEEDFQRLRHVNPHSSVGEAEDAPGRPSLWRIRGAFDLTPRQAAVLAELCNYRERAARNMDRPVFKVINDQTLLEIARQLPHSPGELSRVEGMSSGQIQRHGARLLEAVQRGLSNAPLNPPKTTRPDERYLERLEALRRWRKAAGTEMGVNSEVVLPRDLMLAVALKAPRTEGELDAVLHEVPWRRAHFGEQILKIMVKK